LADPALVPAAIARSLGIREDGRGPLIEQIAGTLSETQMLLILDNYEHLLVAAPVVAHLLAASPGLRVLATSRSPLGLRWEHRFPLAPLDDGAARRLFVERARAISPDITSDATTEPLIARICARLDRLPLAIELAAARAGALSLGGLVERLEQGIGALGGGPRDLPARQRTLRDAIAWSYDLLAEPERLLFRHLAVFPGGATAEAAAAIADQAPPATLDTLASLRESGLLQPPAADGEPRFRMLATVREFAHEQLIAAGEAVDVNRRLVVRMLTLAQEAEPGLRSGGREPWLARLDAEQDNIRAALAWCAEDPASLKAGLRLAATLEWFWHFRNHWREAHDWLERLLARTDEAASKTSACAADAASPSTRNASRAAGSNSPEGGFHSTRLLKSLIMPLQGGCWVLGVGCW